VPAPLARTARRVLLALGCGILAAALTVGALWISLPSVDALAFRIPRTTALIEQRRAEALHIGRRFRIDMRPVRLDQVSPSLVDAVLLSEDAGFFGHGAFDWTEMRNALGHDLRTRRFIRGASTISQQLAKNLYLGTEKSLLRKAREAVLAVKLERALPKRRILALYLNVAEWGNGVFGAEAAARVHFGTAAANLGPAQAAVLASMLPAPRRCDLSSPSRWLKRRSRRVLDRMREAGRLDPAAHAHASAELERILAGPLLMGDDSDEPPEE
jgi:monofunctional biosynthetic peptidoglycan transglycosylase